VRDVRFRERQENLVLTALGNLRLPPWCPKIQKFQLILNISQNFEKGEITVGEAYTSSARTPGKG
jgi:hypothetical protein